MFDAKGFVFFFLVEMLYVAKIILMNVSRKCH